MSEAGTTDPDALLAQLKREEAKSTRGKLKIFFGMSPGVGKTYAMPLAAREKQAEGREVVVGIVETHGRKETEALTEGMPIMPGSQIEYRGTTLTEMDLDSVVTWHPGLAVVDELAHTNAPGSRHPKRYQDVLELLDAGINVYTTLNVQHVGSRSDTVRQSLARRSPKLFPIPFSISPTKSFLRSDAGTTACATGGRKSLSGRTRAVGSKEFFSREQPDSVARNGIARRGRACRPRPARDHVGGKNTGPWKSGDRLLVAVSASPYSERLIRYTRRLASSMEASWIVANIEGPRPLSEEEQTRLTRYLALARQLGAEVITTPGRDVAEALLRVARQNNVTQIVMGKPLGTPWFSFLKPDLLRWLMRNSGNIDIHMIPGRRIGASRRRESIEERLARTPWQDFGIALWHCRWSDGFLIADRRLNRLLGGRVLLFVRSVLAGMRLRRWPTFFLAALSAMLWDFLFIPPRFTFYISNSQIS